MYAAHDAFSRDLRRLAAAAQAGRTADPAVRAGWATFKNQLHTHHSAEDAWHWPALRTKVTAPGEVSVLGAMEAEHARIDPLVSRVDASLAATGLAGLAEDISALTAALGSHMQHEEDQALPLVEAHLGPAGWAAFGKAAGRSEGLRSGAELFPWMLDRGLAVVSSSSSKSRRSASWIAFISVQSARMLPWVAEGEAKVVLLMSCAGRDAVETGCAETRWSTARTRARRVKHPVLVDGVLRDRPDHVPVLDDLFVLKLEDVDDRRAALPGYAHSVRVPGNLVALGKDPLNLAAQLGELLRQEAEERLEAFKTVGDQRIVLHIALAEELRCSIKVLLVQASFEESHGDLFVGLE